LYNLFREANVINEQTSNGRNDSTVREAIHDKAVEMADYVVLIQAVQEQVAT